MLRVVGFIYCWAAVSLRPRETRSARMWAAEFICCCGPSVNCVKPIVFWLLFSSF